MRKQQLHPRTAIINKKQKNQSKKLRCDALGWLVKEFPLAFDNQTSIRPLKLGIMKDILEYAEKAGKDGISKSKLREAVVLFTRRIDYLACLKAREVRIDLNGQPIDRVSDEDAERAAAKIKKRIEKNIKNIRKASNQSVGKPQRSSNYHSSMPHSSMSNYSEPHYSAAQQAASSGGSVKIKHKVSRRYDPAAVARLKEKLGLSPSTMTDEIEES